MMMSKKYTNSEIASQVKVGLKYNWVYPEGWNATSDILLGKIISPLKLSKLIKNNRRENISDSPSSFLL